MDLLVNLSVVVIYDSGFEFMTVFITAVPKGLAKNEEFHWTSDACHLYWLCLVHMYRERQIVVFQELFRYFIS